MKIFVAQIKSIAGDAQGNFARIQAAYNQATKAGCDICLLPELVTSGYLAEDLFFSQDFINAIDQINKDLIESTGKCALILPTIIQDKGNLYNSAIVAQNGKIIGQTNKTILPNYGVFDEKRYFTPGKPQIITINGKKVGVPICEDIWHFAVCDDLQSQGAEIFLVPNASPFEIGKFDLRKQQVIARYNEHKIPFIFCNQATSQDGIIFDGHSFCHDGKISVICKGFCEDSAVVTWREESLLRAPTTPVMARERSDRGHPVIKRLSAFIMDPHVALRAPRDDGAGASAPRDDAEGVWGDNSIIYQALIFGLKSYVEDNGFTKVILGLSGGIDSALVACICADALEYQNVTAYMMPSKITSEDSKKDARAVAKLLNIASLEIPIHKILESYITQLEASKNAEAQDLMYQNLQARIRGSILMAHANKHGSLLITTGNKSEYATGYATLYGDMNGAFNPIKDLYKTQIFALAAYRNSISNVIPENIITKEPTAELATNQKDSDSLPPYYILDKILYSYLELNLPKKELYKNFDQQVVDKVVALVKKSEFKRKQSAPGIKISRLNLEKDRRFPITNLFN
jgi:NAD+ synthetase